jgi:hypothetical protein
VSSKQYNVTIPTTLWVTVRVTIDDNGEAIDAEDEALNAAYEAVDGAVYDNCQGGISLRAPGTHLWHDPEFHNPWAGRSIDVVAVADEGEE